MTPLLRRHSLMVPMSLPGVPDPAAERARREALYFGQYKPDASTTGTLQPPSTLPTVINGDVDMTTNGQILENSIVNGFVTMRGFNQTVRNCWIRGPVTGSGNSRGMVSCFWSTDVPKNALIEDCWIDIQTPYIGYDGLAGHDFTAKRVRISQGSDGFGVQNSAAPNTNFAVKILGCWVEPLGKWWPGGASSAANGSHNDCIQIKGGVGVDNIQIIGNWFQGYISQVPGVGDTGGFDVDNSGNSTGNRQTNANIQLNAITGVLSGFLIADNWLDGGALGINGKIATGEPDGTNLGKIYRNKFDGGSLFLPSVAVLAKYVIDMPTSGPNANYNTATGAIMGISRPTS